MSQDCVVLLHGLARSAGSMETMQEALEDAGYVTANIDYPSRKHTVEALANMAVPEGIAACEGNDDIERIHFVTHSLGGILLRQYLKENRIDKLGRVVMLGPPNQGSEVVDSYARFKGFEWFAGPAGMQLGTGEASVPRQLGPVSFDVGVIAGTQSINPILSTLLPDRDDGKVSVDATRVEGMNDHLELPVTHVFMMRDDEVMDQVVYYLANGRFKRELH